MPDCRLLLGDCRERLAELPDASIGHVVTDPPYGQSNESYDRGVPFEVWRECYRVTGENAVLLSFAGGPTYHRIASDIEAAGWKVRQMWAWVYRDGMITSAYPKEGFDRLAPAMDPICFATKGKVLLDLEREGDLRWSVGHRECGLSARSDGNTAARSAIGHWPRSLTADAVPGFEYFAYRRAKKDHDATEHPNQKPLALMRWLISKLPQPGPILDPFLGSGTTAIAARREGFGFVGCEQSAEYLAIAERRLEAEREGMPLFAEG